MNLSMMTLLFKIAVTFNQIRLRFQVSSECHFLLQKSCQNASSHDLVSLDLSPLALHRVIFWFFSFFEFFSSAGHRGTNKRAVSGVVVVYEAPRTYIELIYLHARWLDLSGSLLKASGNFSNFSFRLLFSNSNFPNRFRFLSTMIGLMQWE